MPRKARIDAPGAVHHIMARGIERRVIFRNDGDRDDFLDRLNHLLVETHTPCYAWALIPNHFHLLLRTGAVPVSTVMRRLLSGYAQAFNRRHRRHGHLFQNRYKSILCQEESYLLELVRYIHLNPLRAGIVRGMRELNTFRYCGHGVLLGKRGLECQHVKAVLKRFSPRVRTARSRYGEFVGKGVARGKRPDLSGGGLVRSAGGWSAVKAMRRSNLFQKADERILGDGEFVERVLRRMDEQLEERYALKARGYDFDRIVKRVAELLEMPPDTVVLASKRPRNVQARSMVCYWAHMKIDMSQTELARRFGISQPAVSAAVHRGRVLIKEKGFGLEY